MKGKIRIAGILILALLCGCAPVQGRSEGQYSASFLDLFDTITVIIGHAESEQAFQAQAQLVHDRLLEYHQLFDIYHEYPGINNLKTVNDHAGIAPVQVDSAILALLRDARAYAQATDGRVNAAMGSVLSLWHDAREEALVQPAKARIPDRSALEEAARHARFEDVHIDEEASSVYLADPLMRLDVGAIAKGWAVEQAARRAPRGLLISVGGNVRATGPKDDLGTPWKIGIEDPNGGDALQILSIQEGSVVTSGDYQRAYRVNGRVYHHIIDPQSLFPANRWRSVSIVCADSALADALSTALFLMTFEEGQALLARMNAEAMWVNAAGEQFFSDGFSALLQA